MRNNLEAGVLEPALTKVKAIRSASEHLHSNLYIFLSRFATEAAVTILRIDDVIKISPEQTEQ